MRESGQFISKAAEFWETPLEGECLIAVVFLRGSALVR